MTSAVVHPDYTSKNEPVKVINLTPHPITITTAFCDETIESSGISRCETIETVLGYIGGLPIIETEFGAIDGLPDAAICCTTRLAEGEVCGIHPARSAVYDETFYEGIVPVCAHCGGDPDNHIPVIFVVSYIVAQACSTRRDVFFPARTVRNADGQVSACTALGQVRS